MDGTYGAQFDFEHFAARRLLHFQLPNGTDECRNVIGNILMLNRHKLHIIASATFRTLSNAWPTARRFLAEDVQCLLCGCAAGDDIRHYLACPVVISALREHLPVVNWPDSAEEALPFHLLIRRQYSELCAVIATGTDLIFSAVQARRHGSKLVTSHLFFARLRALSRRGSLAAGARSFGLRRVGVDAPPSG